MSLLVSSVVVSATGVFDATSVFDTHWLPIYAGCLMHPWSIVATLHWPAVLCLPKLSHKDCCGGASAQCGPEVGLVTEILLFRRRVAYMYVWCCRSVPASTRISSHHLSFPFSSSLQLYKAGACRHPSRLVETGRPRGRAVLVWISSSGDLPASRTPSAQLQSCRLCRRISANAAPSS